MEVALDRVGIIQDRHTVNIDQGDVIFILDADFVDRKEVRLSMRDIFVLIDAAIRAAQFPNA